MLRDWLDAHAIAGWRQAHRLWSLRVALFWLALNGALMGLSAFAYSMDPWLYLALNVVGWIAIGLARIYHQPGLD